ncbi:hypothetical protein RJ639_009428 [Escallonia herrerae]|uniref:RING-type domain-containing protein n=1 Tax=Escallonia herrerae TaxID=1293975 RepID=A0AA88VS00_9ASTE|nr:hypothetical protein RJ639_009428 [Escallonia herrerae]
MTSVSELFYTRRSRFGRDPAELGLDSSLHRNSVHNRGRRGRYPHRDHLHSHNFHTHRDRHDVDACCPPSRRSSIPAHRSSFPEREFIQLNQASSQYSSANVISSGNDRSIQNSQRFTNNDRLPGAVLRARERLVERLTGISPSGNRASPGIHLVDFVVGGHTRGGDPEDWEIDISRDWLAGLSLSADLNTETDRSLGLQKTRKHPPGLTQEALDCLHIEVFGIEGDQRAISTTSEDCCICLESFTKGDELVCLPCGHRFHSCCLDPWIRTCGDCPYCRTGVVVTTYGAIK